MTGQNKKTDCRRKGLFGRWWGVLGPVLLYLLLGQANACVWAGLLAYKLRLGGYGELAWPRAVQIYGEYALIFSIPWAVLSFAVLYWWFSSAQRRRGKRTIPFLLPGQWRYWAALGISSCIAGNLLLGLLPEHLIRSYDATARTLFSVPLAWQILGMGIVIPCSEELVYRGLIYGNCRDYGGFWQSAAISSLLFGLLHESLIQGAYACLLGFLLAWIYEKAGTLLASILAHGTANVASVLASAYVQHEKAAAQALHSSASVRILAFLAAAGVLVWCLWKIRKR